MVRDPDDPEPQADKKRGTPEYLAIRERWGIAPHLKLAKMPIEEIKDALLEAMDTHGPCTFNRIGVAAFGLTADIITKDRVLDMWWALVEDGLIEHNRRDADPLAEGLARLMGLGGRPHTRMPS